MPYIGLLIDFSLVIYIISSFSGKMLPSKGNESIMLFLEQVSV